MKLQGLSIVFGLIVIPLILVLSYYIQLQVDTISLQTSYDTKLLDATHDAMMAFELNTANEDLSSVADSLRTIIDASNNIFINTLATNMGLSNASKSYIQPFIPAVLYTLYDGYYINSPTKKPEIGVDYNGVALEINSKSDDDDKFSVPWLSYDSANNEYTYNPDQTAIEEKESNPSYIFPDSAYKDLTNVITDDEGKDDFGQLLYKKENGKLTTNLSEAKYNTEYVLKSYMPYSARYVNGDIDITVNYTLDNYLTIVGNVGKVYYTKSGYLIKKDLVSFDTSAGGADLSNYNENDAEKKILEGTSVTLKIKAKVHDDAGVENDEDIIISTDGDINSDATRAVIYYTKAKLFSDWVYANLSSIQEQHIIEDITDELEATTQKGSEEIIYKFEGKTNTIFNDSEDPEKDNSTFVNHKYNVIKNSIQYNLNLAMSIYNENTTEGYNFNMPVITNEEWDKIINNISIVSFMQGLNCGLKTYNNYVVVSSTNNELTVIPEEIYFVKKGEENNSLGVYHRIDCPELEETTLTSFKSKEAKYDKLYNKSAGKYDYDHKNLACYTCIIDGNYNSNSIFYNDLTTTDDNNRRYSYYTALGKERYNVYKMNAIKLSEGYEILTGSSTRNIKEIKQIKVTFGHIFSEDFSENTVAIKFDNGNLPNDVFVLNTNQSKEQTLTLTIDSDSATTINLEAIKFITNTNESTKVKLEDIQNAIKSVRIIYK